MFVGFLKNVGTFIKGRKDGAVVYFVLALILYLSIREIVHQLNYPGIHDFIHQFRSWVDAMFFALPLLILKRKRFILLYLIGVNLYFLSIIWYFRVYGGIMPLESYLMVNNLSGTVDSIVDLMSWTDLRVVWPSLLFLIIYFFFYKKSLFSISGYALKNVWLLVFSFLMIFVIVSAPYWPNRRPSWDQPMHMCSIIQIRGFKEYGILNFWIYQIISHRSVTKEERERADVFLEKHRQYENSVACNSTHTNKNLILILVESMQSWGVDLKIEGIEITPFINKLLRLQDVLYFPKVLSQVKDGRSSDAQLILNTGLLPMNIGAASSLCSQNIYRSLPDALRGKGYSSASFLCDEKSFWNQEATTKAYGFDILHDRMAGDLEKKFADESLFTKGFPLLKQLRQPFYTQWVTYSSHMPYDVPLIDSPLKNVLTLKEDIKNYLIALQYVDKCIASFFNRLKEEGLYNNSIIVITGDHEQVAYNDYEGRKQMMAEDCFVPLIIINSPLSSKHIDKVLGQVDIFPSLLSLMGCYDYVWKGVGESVFGDSISNYATFRTGLAAEGVNVSDSVKKYRQECWKVSDILLRMNYFK